MSEINAGNTANEMRDTNSVRRATDHEIIQNLQPPPQSLQLARASVNAPPQRIQVVRRRRRDGGLAPLEVQLAPNNELPSGSDDGNRDLVVSRANGDGNASVTAAPEEAEGSALSSGKLLEMAAQLMHTARNAVSGIGQPSPRRRWAGNGLIFAFFLCVFMFLLHCGQANLRWVAGVTAYDNERSLSIVAGITDALLAQATEVNALTLPYRRTPPAVLERATESVQEMRRLLDTELRRLYKRLGYTGPLDDIRFLIEEHVAYEANVARVLQEELQWLEARKMEYIEVDRATPSKGKKPRATDEITAEKIIGGKNTWSSPQKGATEKVTRGPTPPLSGTQHFFSLLHNRLVASGVLFVLIVLYFWLSGR